MQPLTDTERTVLAAAAKRPDGRIDPLPEYPDAAALIDNLQVKKLIELVPDERPDFEPFLRINYQGLKALHADPDGSAAADAPTALDAFVETKAEIDAALERIRDASEEHFDLSPDDIDWGHVGDVRDYAGRLKEITDKIFKEGEFAEPATGHDGHAFNADGRRVSVHVPIN